MKPSEPAGNANESTKQAQERAREAGARRDAVRRAHERHLEETVRMIRAAEAMHGVARR